MGCETWVRVVARYFWYGTEFRSAEPHCIALPLGIVPDAMKHRLEPHITPHFRFSSVPAAVRQTIDTMPFGVTEQSRHGVWTVCQLNHDEDIGFWFSEVEHDDPVEIDIKYGPNVVKRFALVGV